MKPNIVFMTTGSANSTVCMQMLAALGWNLGPIDQEYFEHRELRRLNVDAIAGRGFDRTVAKQLLADLPAPWAVKDPRLSQTLWRWKDLLAPYTPLLLWVTKDIAYVQRSMRRRFNTHEDWALKRLALCQKNFDDWPHAKLQLDVAQISAAVALWDPARPFAGTSNIAT